MSRHLLTGLSIILLVTSSTPLWCCDTPVFRWALERWGANHPEECYGATIFHKGPLEGSTKSAVDWLKERTWPESNTNIIIRTIDVAEELEESAKKLWEAQEKAEAPWVVLQYPVASRIPVPAWVGPFSEDTVKRMLESPARARVAKRILEGDAAVWLFVESGDKEKDDAAAKVLVEHLGELEKVLEIPRPIDPMGYWEVPDPDATEEPEEPDEPERPSFSVERISRKDPSEALLAKVLLRTEEELEKDSAEEPVVFPVFGRGRALWALVGKGISTDNIEEACMYIVGRCSCEFKWMNPGTDLLMTADWDAVPATPLLQPPELLNLVAPPGAEPGMGSGTTEEGEPETASGSTSEPEAKSVASETPAGTTADAAATTEGALPAAELPTNLLRNLAIALGALLLVVVASAFQLRKRARRN